MDSAAAQCPATVQRRCRTAGNIRLPAEATVGGTEHQIAAVNIKSAVTGQAARRGGRPARTQVQGSARHIQNMTVGQQAAV
ncbi:Uncharacterised protein [Yersinia rohdei]|uniref:Uncharacterized protein n=1 Tax=Yersinia rohdei TaxID=29485 RepID=A0A0U1HXZ6_YERRO|nr:Uncharacterised protein [Yersinia rohdei]